MKNEGVLTPITFEESVMISINAKIGSHNKHSQPSQRLKFIYFIPCFSYSAAILIPFQKENPFITAYL